MSAIPHEITVLLRQWSEGDAEALEDLMPLIYPELRRIARRHMDRESPGHTLQTSALINEAYLRLIRHNDKSWNDRRHFFAVAAQVMRHILTDHAREHAMLKRGGGAQHLPLDDVDIISQPRAEQFIALDEALTRLAEFDLRKAKIVELKFFGGLTVEEIAGVLDLAPITIKREWRAAKAWLQLDLSRLEGRVRPVDG